MTKIFLIASVTFFGAILSPVFAAIHDKIPVLEADLDRAQASRLVNDLSLLMRNIPNATYIGVLEHECNHVLPKQKGVYERLFDCLGMILSEKPIDKPALLDTLEMFLLRNSSGERSQTYGNLDDRLVETFNALQHCQEPLEPDNEHVTFLRGSFLNGGKIYVENDHTALIEGTREKILRYQDLLGGLSGEERSVAQKMWALCSTLIEALGPTLKEPNDIAFNQSFDALKNAENYQTLTHEYGVLRGALMDGAYITLAEFIDDASE